MTTFNPSAPNSARAIQAWQILIGMANNRQTATYEGLSVLMYGKKAAGVLDEILGHIATYCRMNELPILTTIVVGKKRGTPGAGFPIAPEKLDGLREKVYDYDWYNLFPPSENDLKSAFKGALKNPDFWANYP